MNLAFREPLTETPDALPARVGSDVAPTDHRSGALAAPSLRLEGRGLLVVGGPSFGAIEPELVRNLATRLGWPVLADPLSGCRVEGTIAAADAIVRTRAPLPEVVVQLGAPWLSKALGDYVTEAAAAGARVVVVDPWHQRPDPLRVATDFVHSDADAWLGMMAEHASPADPRWLSSWHAMEARAQEAIEGVLATDLSEPQVARTLYRYAAAAHVSIFVAPSMPIRDLEWYAEARPAPPEVMANRGANGIDGVVSTALGFAAAGAPRRTLALMGDLTFLHDVSGLVNLPDVPCTFVVVDNGGGGIFSFLPQATTLRADVFEDLFGTPPTSDVGAVARGFGLAVEEVTKLSELEPALASAPASPALVRVRVPSRAQNVAVHEAINQAVRLALRP
jgi:2-succinyl-5-enolpyruvyl-6-hydroxy-3-cyclohexene-1-carboxylate synthase